MESSKNVQNSRIGLAAALSAYCMWGVFPLYWKALQVIPSWEIICHRIVWSLVLTFILLILRGRQQALLEALTNRRTLLTTLATSTLLGSNWLVYIWAVNNGNIVESSLGYFINPLIAVLLGVVFLQEKLRIGQWIALGVALGGVLYLTFSYGRFPWIGLTLAITFALYSLLRKTAALHSLEGLFCETVLLSIPAGLTLLYLTHQGTSGFVSQGPWITLMLIGTGLVTSIPLLLFVFGAQRITMTAIGLMQYLAPTIQFLIGLLIFHEPFPPAKMIGFAIIWSALALFTIEGITLRLHHRTRPLD
ncbi:MAG: EamA family transporter RarD [Deltaproteobacteria bacterium]|nr:EamA family transporter RarD [Deltaproteobacteria bacterium]